MCFFECAETGKKAGFCDSALTIYYNPFCRKSQCFWKTVSTNQLLSSKASPERGGGPAKLVEGFSREVQLLVQPCRNRPAEFARCPRCPPGACQRRLLPFPVSVMLIFKRFLVQVGDFISYGVCKFVLLGSPLGHPKGVPCAELASRRLD